jgi:hypothetical protein
MFAEPYDGGTMTPIDGKEKAREDSGCAVRLVGVIPRGARGDRDEEDVQMSDEQVEKKDEDEVEAHSKVPTGAASRGANDDDGDDVEAHSKVPTG